MSDPTFKSMTADGTIKRADSHKVRYQDLHVEPGFNWRDEGDDLDADNAALTEYIAAGGTYPALEVRPRADGGVWIVDGHRRHRCIGKAIEQGAPMADKNGEVWVTVVQFVGNDAARAARVLTSQEGRKLTQLEMAKGYKRLAGFGLDVVEIAALVHKTRQHVDQLLILANANTDVHKMVAAGTVSGTVAIDMVRKHGEMAGAFIAAAADKSRKGKATAGSVKPWTPPAKVVQPVVSKLHDFLAAVPLSERVLMESAREQPNGNVRVNALALLELFESYNVLLDAAHAQNQKQQTKAAKAAQMEIGA